MIGVYHEDAILCGRRRTLNKTFFVHCGSGNPILHKEWCNLIFWLDRPKMGRFSVLLSNPIRKCFCARSVGPHFAFRVEFSPLRNQSSMDARRRFLATKVFLPSPRFGEHGLLFVIGRSHFLRLPQCLQRALGQGNQECHSFRRLPPY